DDGQNTSMILSHNIFEENLPSSTLDELSDNDFPIRISWVTKEKNSNSSVSKVLYKKNIYLQKTTEGYRFSKSSDSSPNHWIDLNNNPQDSIYHQFSLSKNKIQELKNQANDVILYSAFYVDNLSFANKAKGNIKLTASQESENPLGESFPILELNKPFMAQSRTFYGTPNQSWGQFLYNGGKAVILQQEGEESETVLSDLEGAIKLDKFSLSGEEEQIDPDEDDIDMTIYYTLYNQDNNEGEYFNDIVFYEFDNNNNPLPVKFGIKEGKLEASTGRFGQPDLYEEY